MESIVIDRWTGRTAALLQAALRMTNERFADQLGISTRTVVRWHSSPDVSLRPTMQELLDTAYERAGEVARARFSGNFASPLEAPAPAASPAVDSGVSRAELELLQARMELLQKELSYLMHRAQS